MEQVGTDGEGEVERKRWRWFGLVCLIWGYGGCWKIFLFFVGNFGRSFWRWWDTTALGSNDEAWRRAGGGIGGDDETKSQQHHETKNSYG